LKLSHTASMILHLRIFMTCAFWIVPDERAETTAELSTWKIMWWPHQRWPHLRTTCSTTYISLKWMSQVLNQCRHLDEYQWCSNIPPRPLDPLASVYTQKVLQGDSRIWTPFQCNMYADHHHMSEHMYAGMCLHTKLFLKVIENFISPLMNVRP